MKRQFVYPGQIPQDTDLLLSNKNPYIGLAKLAALMIGTNNLYHGLVVGPVSPAALQVQVAPGEIYSLQNVDNTAYGSVAADTTHQIVKQGVLLDAATLNCAAPTTNGYSINYLIEATFLEVDTNLTVLPYYNASNPSQAWNGPNNSGTQQATVRDNQVSVQAKAGVAAPTGSQTTPALDAGYVALAVVTVAYGQSTITSSSITAQTTAQIPTDIMHLLQQDGANYAVDTGATNAYAVAYTPAVAALVEGMPLSFRAAHSNTGACTLNVNGLGAQSLVSSTHNALVGGEILAGSIVTAVWNANANVFELQSGQQAGRLIQVQIFQSSATYMPTPGTNAIIVEAQGGGGGGGGTAATGASQFSIGGGGQSGAYAKSRFTTGFSGGISVTVGAAGAAGAAGNNQGGTGGNTSFGSLLSVGGGIGGLGGAATAAGSILFQQTPGGQTILTPNGNIFTKSQSVISFGWGNGQGSFVAGSGNDSPLGTGGRGAIGATGAGGGAVGNGAGGGGAGAGTSAAAQAGGIGGVGCVIVWEYS